MFNLFFGQLPVNLSDDFLTRFLAKFVARVLTRVWGEGKNHKWSVQYYPA